MCLIGAINIDPMFIPLIEIAQAAEAAREASEGGIGAIGINLPALAFQLLNFAVLLWLLKKFAYKPIIGILEQRRLAIEESLRTASELEKAKAALETTQAEIIKQAESEAARVIAASKKQAAEILKETEARAQESADRTFKQAEAKIEQTQAETRAALKNEMLRLVAAATAKIIKVKLDPKHDAALIEESLNGLNK